MNELAKVLYHYGFIKETNSQTQKIICPFHDDVKPSMQVFLDTNRFKCYGCQKYGDHIDFIKAVKKCDDLEAYVHLNKIMNNKAYDKIQIRVNKRKDNKELLKDAYLYYSTLPTTDWFNIDDNHYLINRGFSRETLTELDIRENFNHIYGVCAPLRDNGKFRGYVCRATVNEFNGESVDRKYLYNTGFSRRNSLIGNYYRDWVVVCEGYFDYVALVQAGFKNAVCIMGWKATPKQIAKLQKVTDKIITALDNTPLGDEGSEYLDEYFYTIRFPFPSGCKDPADMDRFEMNKAKRQIRKEIEKWK